MADEQNFLYDPNDESARIFQQLRYYYGNFTEGVRERLLAKNVTTPSSLLELSYQPRQEMLSSNIPQQSDVLDASEDIRKELLSKLIPNLSDIESESDAYRKEMLAKNGVKLTDIETDSKTYREDNLQNVVPSQSDIETDSEVYREDNLQNVVPSQSDIETDSVDYREGNLANVVPSQSDIETDSAPYREDNLANVVPSQSDIETDSADYREDNLSNVVPSESDIETDSEVYREDNLSNVVPSQSDIESDSVDYRNDNLSNVVPSDSDIETDSAPYREDNLSNVVPSQSDIESDSADYREDNLANVVPSQSDIETDSEPYREDNLSNVVPSQSDIESDSADYREDNLANVVPSESDIETDSVDYREDNLSNVVPSQSDIETDSAPYREDNLANVVPSDSDIETDSADYREDDLQNNVPSFSDIETDSAPYREDDLENNVPSFSDIETDSEPFRAEDLTENVPSFSDIETDSEPYRTDDLQNNVAINSDIETDSEPYRADDLQNNVPINSDIETDSEPYREDDLSNNVPIDSDIETDSEPYREDDLSNNVPSETDIETDSEPYREDDLSNNVASESDIEEDSIPFRVEDLSLNVPSLSDIETDSIPFRTDDLTNNVPSTSDIETDSETFRVEDLQNNVPSSSDILSDSQAPREGMLAQNQGLGLLGVNFEGFGTSAFVGVSRNFALGLVVREVMQTRNTYTPRNPYRTSGADAIIEDGNYQGYFNQTVREEIADQFKRGQEELTRPETKTYEEYRDNLFFDQTTQATFEVDTEGQMNKLEAGNEFGEAYDFRPRSIKNLMNDIAQRDPLTAPLAGNYTPNATEFSIGGIAPDGSPRVARKRYTIDNPYFSGDGLRDAGKLLFSITNYAIPVNSPFRTMYFPPYIQSFQENASNNWNTHEFLGRPEPVYTYNNSTRAASITFFVLTDYAQDVELGTDWTSPDLQRILFNTDNATNPQNIDRVDHFTDRWREAIEVASEKNNLKKRRADNEKEIQSLNAQLAALTGENVEDSDFDQVVPTNFDIALASTGLRARKMELEAENRQINDSLVEIIERQRAGSESGVVPNLDTDFFSETTETNRNTVATALGTSNTEDFFMVERLRDMKETLQYQPAYFSGDKVDFNRKMTFMQRLFRPRAAVFRRDSGFAFTKPPVAHIRLGDWLNHDAIITDMNIEYTDSTWALEPYNDVDRVGVQPMFAVVTINFNIIGQYGNRGGGVPLLADNASGFYNPYDPNLDRVGGSSSTVGVVEVPEGSVNGEILNDEFAGFARRTLSDGTTVIDLNSAP